MELGEVFLVEGKRTPHAKAGLDLADVAAPFLGTYLLTYLLDNNKIPASAIDEVIIGNIGAPARYANVSRVIALEAGLDEGVSAYTVHRNCASGMEALSQAFLKIASGRADLVFAGGVENMTQMPLIFGKEMTDMFMNVMKAKKVPDKLKVLKDFRPGHLAPVIAIEQGLTDPFEGINMGQTAELVARELGITRQEQDEYANNSHFKAAAATESGRLAEEILPITVGKKLDKILASDVGPRNNSTVEGLGKLKPFFEKKSGTVTVGNSCPITDGGSLFLMASAEAVKKYNLKPIARMVDFHFHGLSPARMGMGPLVAMDGLFKRSGFTLDQMDKIEINEAFAAQILGVKKGFTDQKVADAYKVDKLWGEIPEEKLNVAGGAIALGHPVGSSGSRIVLTLAHNLKQSKEKYGIASLCIGGGQGGAVIIENLAQ